MTDVQIQKIMEQLADHEKRIRKLETVERISKPKRVSVGAKSDSLDDLILSITNKIGECEECEEIQNKILDKTDMEGKILLCFYISYKYFKNIWLTTGDIEKITSGLGTKTTAGNASNKITGGLRKYLESGAVRKKGQPTPYRLNRKGAKRFNEIIYVREK